MSSRISCVFCIFLNQLTVALRFESAASLSVAKISNFSYFLIFLFYSGLASKYSKHLKI